MNAQAPAPDLGADGDAMQARPRETRRIEGVRVSSTRSVAIDVTAYTDAHLIDRMHHAGQLSDRQHAAALRLYGLFLAAGLEPRTSARQETLREPVETMEAEADGEPVEDARVAYRRILRGVGPHFAWTLDGMCHGQHPGVRWLATLQSALGVLADDWEMEK